MSFDEAGEAAVTPGAVGIPVPPVMPRPAGRGTSQRPSLRERDEERPRASRRRTLALLGPAFVAAVAYVDPGNFATNFQAGAEHGYLLVWVVVMASLMAMLIQYQTAKLGLVTRRNLPELCREQFPEAGQCPAVVAG